MNAARARQAISLVDLTNLSDSCSVDDVEALCQRAVEHGTAAVCVWPDFVAVASRLLAGTGLEIATVVNFPTGDERAFSVVNQVERALADGATEIDVVMPHRALLAGDTERASAMLGAVRSATEDRARMKVILETGELPDRATVVRAAELAIAHGADFIKTSTGKTAQSATTDAVAAMLSVIARTDRPVGIKPSGGISTAADAERYVGLADDAMGDGWVTPATFRFGASGLLTALIDAVAGETPAADATSDPSAY